MSDSYENCTFAMIKPEGYKHSTAVTDITERITKTGMTITCFKEVRNPKKEMVERHYQEHQGKSYFNNLVEQIVGNPIIVMILKDRTGNGESSVEKWREMIGSFKEGEREPGTIRGDYMKPGDPNHNNYVHGSDSSENAQREMRIWFSEKF